MNRLIPLLALLVLTGCKQFGNISQPDLARNNGLGGATLNTDFAGNSQFTSSLPAAISQLDFDKASLAARALAGDGASLSAEGIVAFNGLSTLNMEGFLAKFNDDGGISELSIAKYGGDREAMYAALTSQTDLYKETLREMSADQRDIAIKSLEEAGNVPDAVINALEIWSSMGLPSFGASDDEPDTEDGGGDPE